MRIKTDGADRRAKNCTLKATGLWRDSKYKGKSVLVSPCGTVYFGTPNEVTENKLCPSDREWLSRQIRFTRKCDFYTTEEKRSIIREKRRDAIRMFGLHYNDGMSAVNRVLRMLAGVVSRRNHESGADACIIDMIMSSVVSWCSMEESNKIPMSKHELEYLSRFVGDKWQSDEQGINRLSDVLISIEKIGRIGNRERGNK